MATADEALETPQRQDQDILALFTPVISSHHQLKLLEQRLKMKELSFAQKEADIFSNIKIILNKHIQITESTSLRSKQLGPQSTEKVAYVVTLVQERNDWPTGLVVNIIPSQDNKVGKVEVGKR